MDKVARQLKFHKHGGDAPLICLVTFSGILTQDVWSSELLRVPVVNWLWHQAESRIQNPKMSTVIPLEHAMLIWSHCMVYQVLINKPTCQVIFKIFTWSHSDLQPFLRNVFRFCEVWCASLFLVSCLGVKLPHSRLSVLAHAVWFKPDSDPKLSCMTHFIVWQNFSFVRHPLPCSVQGEGVPIICSQTSVRQSESDSGSRTVEAEQFTNIGAFFLTAPAWNDKQSVWMPWWQTTAQGKK